MKNLKGMGEEEGVDLSNIGQWNLRYGSSEVDLNSINDSLENILEYPTERFRWLQVPVPEFQEANQSELQNLRCTRGNPLRGTMRRNDWVWIQAGEDSEWGAVHGRLPARLQALLKIQDIVVTRTHLLYIMEVLEVVN